MMNTNDMNGIVDWVQKETNNYQIQYDPWTVQTIPFTATNYIYPTKSAREQVQDEILLKMAIAIENDDLKQAKELAKLAKAIKEL